MNVICFFTLLLLASPALSGQSEQINFPDLSIEGATIDVVVDHDSDRDVYLYTYTVHAPPSSEVAIRSFKVDVSGTSTHDQDHAGLRNQPLRDGMTDVQPATTLPVGLIAPSDVWITGRSRAGQAAFLSVSAPAEVPPGESRIFIVESPYPPGMRRAVLGPDMQPLFDFVDSLPEGTGGEEDSEWPTSEDWDISMVTIGPIDPAEIELFDGRGQNPTEVNKFIQFANPTANRLALNGGPQVLNLIVYYGESTDAMTFSATLNGVDISDRFSPSPGGGDWVPLSLGRGRHTLTLAISGKKLSGQSAVDKDTIVISVE